MSNCTRYPGLDVHAETITAAFAGLSMLHLCPCGGVSFIGFDGGSLLCAIARLLLPKRESPEDRVPKGGQRENEQTEQRAFW